MIKKFSVESILVMLLFIIFTASIGILIVQGRVSYESIVSDKNSTEEVRIAFAYLDKKIKQNDRINGITLMDNPYNDLGALQITHTGIDEGYYTTLFYDVDGIYEVMTYMDEPIDRNLGEKIITLVKPMKISYDSESQLIQLSVDGLSSMKILVKSKVVTANE